METPEEGFNNMKIRSLIGLPVAVALLLVAAHLGAAPAQEEGGATTAGGEAMPELDLPDTLPSTI